MTRWLREAHRWLSIAFTVGVLLNIILALLLTGLYLFALPYIAKSRRARGR